MPSSEEEKIARKIAPTMRRAIVVALADSLTLFALQGNAKEGLPIWSTELTRESDVDVLSLEVAGVAVEESAAEGATRFSFIASKEGQTVGELAFRTKADKKSEDSVGSMLLPDGADANASLVRMLMRHTEGITRISMASVERRESVMLDSLERMMKVNMALQESYAAEMRKGAEAARADRAHEIALLEADTRHTAVREGVTLMKQVGPRLLAKLTGDDVVSPLLGIVAKLSPEKIEMMKAAGMVDADEGAKLLAAWEKLQPKTKALPAQKKAAE